MPPVVLKKIDAFFSRYRLRYYTKGQILILNGDKTDHIFYLIKGRVKKYDISRRGDEIIINVYQTPSFFPMSLAITDLENKYIYEAETDIVLRQAPVDEVVKFVQENADVNYDLLRRVYIGIEGVLGRMVHLMSSSAEKRLLYELIIEAHRFSKITGRKKCAINISEKDLGARAGLTRETVSREIHKLKNASLIQVNGKQIVITDLPTLEARLQEQSNM